jgi:hypothetical protein
MSNNDKFEFWQHEFSFEIMRIPAGKWIAETIATLHFDDENALDRNEKAAWAKIMVDALNESAVENSADLRNSLQNPGQNTDT